VGAQKVQDAKVCCVFYRTVFRSFDRRQFSETSGSYFASNYIGALWLSSRRGPRHAVYVTVSSSLFHCDLLTTILPFRSELPGKF